MTVLSFGSNCEVGMMINRYYNNNIYSNLFNWTNITLDNLILVLNNIECLYNNNNVEFIYRVLNNGANVYQSKNIEDIKNFNINNPNNYSIHIDYEFFFNKKNIYWTHGIIMDINEFINSNSNNLESYKSSILSKFNHLVENTIKILNNNTDIIKIYIKCLKNEYTINDLKNLINLFINKSNIYIGIIYESEEEINIESKNTLLIRSNKLTAHNEAIYDHLYNTQEKYFYLFENLDKISNSYKH
jgi:hypothetical protein